MSVLTIFLKSYFDAYTQNEIIGGTIGLSLFLTPVIWLAITYAYYYFKAQEIHITKIFQYNNPLAENRIQLLKAQMPYYNKLSVENKKLFEKRVHHFLLNKTFTSQESGDITEEMKVMIAAIAIQILFGVDAYYLSHFRNIHIVFDKEPVLKSLRHTDDIIIHWNSFEAGYHSPHDGYNPGLKIMAMALSLEHQLNKLSKYMFNNASHKAFHKLYKEQAEKYILSGKSKYNNYKEVDRDEYFAVAIEYFFERPEHFYEHQMSMYMALSKLLRQDPLGNYTYKRK